MSEAPVNDNKMLYTKITQKWNLENFRVFHEVTQSLVTVSHIHVILSMYMTVHMNVCVTYTYPLRYA